MKRIILLLSVLLMLFLLSCGKKEVPSPTHSPDVIPTQEVTEDSLETEPVPTDLIEEITEEEIDELIKDITLKHPKSPFTLYIMEIYKKEKSTFNSCNCIYYSSSLLVDWCYN